MLGPQEQMVITKGTTIILVIVQIMDLQEVESEDIMTIQNKTTPPQMDNQMGIISLAIGNILSMSR